MRDEWLPVNAEAMSVLQRMAARVEGKGALVPGGVEEIRRVLETRFASRGSGSGYIVNGANTSWPSGVNWFRGLFGQHMYTGLGL